MRALNSVLVVLALVLGTTLPVLADKPKCAEPITCDCMKEQAWNAAKACMRTCEMNARISGTREYSECMRLPMGESRRTCMARLEVKPWINRCDAERAQACSDAWRVSEMYDYKCNHNFCDAISK